MTHYLESLNDDEIVFEFLKFEADYIKECILNYFKKEDNRNDELWFYKVSNDKKTVGDTYIDTFVYHNGNVCKEIQKGSRTFYKKI